MKFSWKAVFGAALFGATLVLGVGLIFQGSAGAESVYHRGNDAEPGSLDPHRISGVWENNIVGDLFTGLMIEDSWGNPVKDMAKSYSVSEDGKIYTFILRKDAVWSDGKAITASDFVYSFRRILNPQTAAKYASLLYSIQNAEALNTGEETDFEKLGVRAIDDKTLEIRLHTPTPYFIQLLTHYTTWPVPRHAIEKHGAQWIKPDNIVSSGPYLLKEWVPQAHIKLGKNPKFFDAENVGIDTVYYYPIEDENEALKRFRAGEIDSFEDFPSAQYTWLKEKMPAQVKVAPYLGTYYYAINTQKKPYDDVRVRRALSMAVDRELLAEKILGTGEVPAYSFVPKGIYNYTPAQPDFAKWDQSRRIGEAKKLMKAAGFTPDQPLIMQLKYNTSSTHEKIAIAIADMWKDIGVVVEHFVSETAVHYASLRAHDYEVGRSSWIADYNDAQNFLFIVESKTKGFNYAQYANPDYDALMEQAAKMTDLMERAKVLHKAEAIFLEDMPYIPIYFYTSKNLVSPKLKGYHTIEGDKINAVDMHRSRWISLEE